MRKTDEEYMSYALELAKRGEGMVSPNPMVGCVVVDDDGRIIAEGWHERYGGYHAERNALTKGWLTTSEPDFRGATMYVTLEPCCHTGKTPPCTDIIIEKGIKKVCIGSNDPNPLVAGGGIAKLREAGVEVVTGVLKEECDRLNEVFFHYITSDIPFVVMKYAMTLDGKIATHTGDSKWVSSEMSRDHVQTLRKRYSAILAGIGTVIADDPMLNYRGSTGGAKEKNSENRAENVDIFSENSLDGIKAAGQISEENEDLSVCQPIRIILDSNLRIPLDSQIVQTARQYTTIVVRAAKTDIKSSTTDNQVEEKTTKADRNQEAQETKENKIEEKKQALLSAGVKLWEIEPDENGRVSIPALLKKMHSEGIDSVLVEGGTAIHGAFLDADRELRRQGQTSEAESSEPASSEGCIHRIYAYIAPKLVGGDAPTPIAGNGIDKMAESPELTDVETILFGEDICLTGRLG